MKQTTVIYLSLLLSLPASLSSAAPVYTWTDDAGITHFSETPPPDPATDTQLVNIQPPPAAANTPDGDFYSVINQADRMERSRLANEKLAAACKEAAPVLMINLLKKIPFKVEPVHSIQHKSELNSLGP